MTERFAWLNIPTNDIPTNEEPTKVLKETIHSSIRRTLHFPSRGELMESLGEAFTVRQIMSGLAELELEGFLAGDGDWYLLASKDHRQESRPVKEQVVEKAPEVPVRIKRTTKPLPIKKQTPRRVESVYGVPIYIIQFLMAIIGIGAAIISVYYTTIWLLEFLPWAFSLLLASIMVGFSVSAFETIILFMSGHVTDSRFAKAMIASGFIVLWIVVTFFSIMSTVAGQYNRHVINLREQTKQGISTGRAQWVILQEQKAELQTRLGEYRSQISTLNKIMSGMDDVESRTKNNRVWYETQFRLQKANAKMADVAESLDKVREEERGQLNDSKKTGIILSTTSTKEIPNFYGWMSNVTRIEPDKVQFWMSLFPAIFVDIIAPISLAIALFLRRKKR